MKTLDSILAPVAARGNYNDFNNEKMVLLQ